MKKLLWLCWLPFPLLRTAQSANLQETRLLTLPAISKGEIAFVYAGDLWVPNLEGWEVRCLFL
jgi:hypothetical protein